ncbi:MAG: hypothetical protein KF901_30635 [Myxococcales bacterium]|nr:hypothetical protein [Myxococcales bacterium]
MRFLLYPLFGLGVVGGYAAFQVTGVDPFAAGVERTMVPPEARVAPAATPLVGAYGRYSRGYRVGK